VDTSEKYSHVTRTAAVAGRYNIDIATAGVSQLATAAAAVIARTLFLLL